MSRKKRETKDAEKYDKVYRFRCFEILKKRAARVAKERGYGDASDLGREALMDNIERWEKKLGLKPLRG